MSENGHVPSWVEKTDVLHWNVVDENDELGDSISSVVESEMEVLRREREKREKTSRKFLFYSRSEDS